jgi:hypothetical protein
VLAEDLDALHAAGIASGLGEQDTFDMQASSAALLLKTEHPVQFSRYLIFLLVFPRPSGP